MDEDTQEESPAFVVCYRSPVFAKDEVKALIDLVSKYKTIILNKCTNTTTNLAKDEAWIRICKEINKKGFKHKRTVESLKTKWENLKKEARKLSKNLIDVKYSDLNDVLAQIVILINEGEASNRISEVPSNNIVEAIDIGQDAESDTAEENDNNLSNLSDDDVCKQSDMESNDGDAKVRSSRSLNFSPQECSLLLKCVRDEKDNIFSKETTRRAVKLKNNAWAKITCSFNKLSPQKRTTKVLRTKFTNMKRLTKNVNIKNCFAKNQHERLEENCEKKIKQEPNLDYKRDIDIDNDSDDDNEDFQEIHGITNKQNDDTMDPLSAVLNGDSGLESISHFGSCSQFDNKEVVKLKLELLKYQLETAKLERQRIQGALEAESSERQSKAIEMSLRLRAARLNVVAAESKLPSTHPALEYNDQEKQAQQYLQQFQHT